MLPYLIGISGKKGEGKDTFAYVLQEALRYQEPRGDVVIQHFADPLKKHIGEGLFGLRWEQIHSPAEKEGRDPFWGRSPREILQLAGTECFRAVFGGDFWVRVAERSLPGEGIVIFPDVRFREEAEMILGRGGFLIRVTSPWRNTPGGSRVSAVVTDQSPGWADVSADDHASETALDNFQLWDWRIENEGSIGDLKGKAEEVARAIKVRVDQKAAKEASPLPPRDLECRACCFELALSTPDVPDPRVDLRLHACARGVR